MSKPPQRGSLWNRGWCTESEIDGSNLEMSSQESKTVKLLYPSVITPILNLFKFTNLKPVKGWKQKDYLNVMG